FRRPSPSRSGSSSSATRSTRFAPSTRPISAPSARSSPRSCCRRRSSCCPRAAQRPSAIDSAGQLLGYLSVSRPTSRGSTPVLAPGPAGRTAAAGETWRTDGARIVLASDQPPRLADVLGEAGHEVAVVGRIAEAPPPGAITLIERSLNGGFIGGPDGLAFVT